MSSHTDHIEKETLLKYINCELYFDDMVVIERHLESCEKCNKQYINLKSKNTNALPDEEIYNFSNELSQESNSSIKLPSLKTLVIGISIVLTIIVAVYAVLNFKLSDIMTSSDVASSPNKIDTVYSQNNDSTFEDSSATKTDTLIFSPATENEEKSTIIVNTPSTPPPAVDSIKKEEIIEENNTPSKNENPPQEIISDIQEEPTSVAGNDQTIKENPNTASTEIKEIVQEEINEKETTEEPQVANAIVEEPKLNWLIKVYLTDDQSATPEGGIQSFNQSINSTLNISDIDIDPNILPYQITFNIDDSAKLNQFSFSLSQNLALENRIREFFRKGPKWKPYISDDFIQYNQANIEIKLEAH